MVSGVGTTVKRGSVIKLQDDRADRRVSAIIDTNTKKGTASIQMFLSATSVTIIDRNIANNICTCR